MSEKEFDRIFREKLENHSSPVPDDMWQRIHAEKDKDRKVFILPSWMLVAAVLIIIATVWVVIENKSSSVNPQQLNAANNKTEQSNKQEKQSKSSSSDTNEITEKTQMADKTKSEKNIQPPERVGNKNTSSVISSNDNHQKQKFIEENYTPLYNNSIEPEKENAVNKTEENHQQKEIAKNNNETNVIDKGDKPAKDFFENKQAISEAAQVNKQANKSDKKDEGDVLIAEVFFSPELALRSTSANYNSNTSVNLAYTEQKKAVESERFSFSFGFNLSKKITKHLSLKTGIHYTQVNQKFTYNPGANRYVSVVDNRDATDSYGNLLSPADTMNILAYNPKKIPAGNSIKAISIPLLFSYETGGHNFNFAFTAGPVFNIYNMFSGKTLDPYTYTAIDINSHNIYKHNTGLGLYAGVSAMKHISNNIQLYAEPHLQYNLGQITKPSAPFKQKIHTTGVSFGLRYNFSK